MQQQGFSHADSGHASLLESDVVITVIIWTRKLFFSLRCWPIHYNDADANSANTWHSGTNKEAQFPTEDFLPTKENTATFNSPHQSTASAVKLFVFRCPGKTERCKPQQQWYRVGQRAKWSFSHVVTFHWHKPVSVQMLEQADFSQDRLKLL